MIVTVTVTASDASMLEIWGGKVLATKSTSHAVKILALLLTEQLAACTLWSRVRGMSVPHGWNWLIAAFRLGVVDLVSSGRYYMRMGSSGRRWLGYLAWVGTR